jgi:hypothetical protein
MIFDPGVPPASFCVDGSQGHLLVTHKLSEWKNQAADSTHAAASAAPAASFMTGNPEVIEIACQLVLVCRSIGGAHHGRLGVR